MNEGAMFHGNGGFGPPMFMMGGQMERQGPRQYPIEVLQYMGGVGSRGGSSPGTPRRSQPRKSRQPRQKGDNTAFDYESDDSSISSNASGSNKSSEKGDSASRSSEHSSGSGSGAGGAWARGAREWRARRRGEGRRGADRHVTQPQPYQVKYTPDELLNGSQWDTLSQEIWDKFLKSQQTEETFRKKMNLWRYIYVTIKAIFPRYGLYVVGSTMSGFGLDTSDMDLCLYVRPLDNLEPRTHALIHLGFILNYIKSLDAGAELIQAKVPILKLCDARHGLQVDLNCNNIVGIRNTNLLHCYSTLDWRVRPLVAICKLWAGAHHINDARHRTLSSYSLTLMVIHFLQCGVSPAVLPCLSVRASWWDSARCVPHYRSANRHTLGELFALFLQYYADFPYSKMAISVRCGQPIPVAECRMAKSHKNDPHQWKLLCVEEPFDLTNTARSVYDPETFERIVDTFRECHKSLSSGLRLCNAWPKDSTLDR